MTFQHFDTVIAFVALMLVASLVVTAGTQLIISLLGLRGANLRRSLSDLFETASDDSDAQRYASVIARRVLRQPLVSGSVFSRFGVPLDKLPFVPADAAGKLRWAGAGIPLQPWLLGALSGFFLWPLSLFLINRLIPVDFCSYSAAVTSYIPFLDLCDHAWRSGAILGALFGGLISRWRLATSIRLEELVALLEKLSAPAGGTLPDPAQRAMLVIAGEARTRTRPSKINTTSAQMERMFRGATDEGEGGVAVAVERAVTQVTALGEARLDGLNLWFEHAMDRASQRFTLQARIITVVLSLAIVFSAHLDAVRIFQSLSSEAQLRAQLGASADALAKQAEQFSRAKESSRTVVPDVYRTAMTAVLEVPAAPAEQAKLKSRHSSRSAPTPSPTDAEQISSNGSTPGEVQVSMSAVQVSEAGVQATPAVAQQASEPQGKQREGKNNKQAKAKPSAKEREMPLAPSGEDRALREAKLTASKALEATPGFASREDADLWLRETLEGDPAVENLAASYEREVNSDLPGDADKLIDHSASIKRGLARSEFHLLPETWPGWHYNEHELPGLVIAVVFLSLCAPLCYNILKSLASLRPLPALK
jgi:hypothetical protein